MSENPSRINWASRLSQILCENSSIPSDVTFKITEADVVHDVKAHKNILAMVSTVFESMFFVHNTTDMSAREIPIPDTTKPAFQILIDAIYEVRLIEDSLKGKSVHEVFAVLYLVVKYEIPELVQAVKECLSSFPFTRDTVVEVASDAMEFLETFQEDAQNLLLLCAKFLKNELAEVASVLRFVAENQDQMIAVNKLLILIHNIAPTILCPNCQQEPCKNGIKVKEDEFRLGLNVSSSDTGKRFELGRNVKGLLDVYNASRTLGLGSTIPTFLFRCQ